MLDICYVVKKLPGEYVTDFIGDSGIIEQTKLSAFGTKGSELEGSVITN